MSPRALLPPSTIRRRRWPPETIRGPSPKFHAKWDILVLDAGVVATPDPVLGEAICACIVPGLDAPDLAQLRSFVGDALARHKLPDELCLVKEVPRTKIGKVDRAALTALVTGEDLPRQRWRPR